MMDFRHGCLSTCHDPVKGQEARAVLHLRNKTSSSDATSPRRRTILPPLSPTNLWLTAAKFQDALFNNHRSQNFFMTPSEDDRYIMYMRPASDFTATHATFPYNIRPHTSKNTEKVHIKKLEWSDGSELRGSVTWRRPLSKWARLASLHVPRVVCHVAFK